jgi:c-di-GMP-related signal transduction protein
MSGSLHPHYAVNEGAYCPAVWRQSAWRAAAATHKQVYIALQPIFDAQKRVFGYEALYRSTKANRFIGDVRNATGSIIEDWLLDGLDKYTEGKPVFLNCGREDLIEFLTLLPVSTVVEVLETVQVDDRVLDACRKIKAFGHLIALDDFQLEGSHQKLIEIADYIKVDFRIDGKERRKEVLSLLKNRPLKFIAEKIETRAEFEAALEEGFHLFQGCYLARPILLSKGRSYNSWLNYLRMHWPFGWRRHAKGKRSAQPGK